MGRVKYLVYDVTCMTWMHSQTGSVVPRAGGHSRALLASLTGHSQMIFGRSFFVREEGLEIFKKKLKVSPCERVFTLDF